MKFVLLFILLFVATLLVKADEARYRNVFTSANDKYELRLADENWSLIEKSTKKEFYRLKGDISSMTVLVSDDGKMVIAIDDYSEQDLEKNPEVLLFYNNGKKVKGYKINDLLENANIVTVSSSHFKWLLRDADFSIKDSRIKLTTFEMNHLTFNIESGDIFTKKRDEVLSGNTLYVFGKITNLGGDEHEIEVICAIYGNIEKGNKVKFSSDKIRWEGSGFLETLIIKDGKLVDTKGIILNSCK